MGPRNLRPRALRVYPGPFYCFLRGIRPFVSVKKWFEALTGEFLPFLLSHISNGVCEIWFHLSPTTSRSHANHAQSYKYISKINTKLRTQTRFPIYLLSLQLSANIKASVVRNLCVWNLPESIQDLYEVTQQPSHAQVRYWKLLTTLNWKTWNIWDQSCCWLSCAILRSQVFVFCIWHFSVATLRYKVGPALATIEPLSRTPRVRTLIPQRIARQYKKLRWDGIQALQRAHHVSDTNRVQSFSAQVSSMTWLLCRRRCSWRCFWRPWILSAPA